MLIKRVLRTATIALGLCGACGAHAAVFNPAIAGYNGTFVITDTPNLSPSNSWYSNDPHNDIGSQSAADISTFLTGLGVTGTIDSVSSMSVGSLTGHTVSVTGTGANIFAIHFGSNELIFEFSALLTSFQLTLGCPQGHSNCEGKHNLSNIIAFDNIPTIPTSGSGDPLATPLPAALPLFASGGALLGFIGWRRKRKAIT